VLDLRLFRASLVPFVVVLAVVAFSVGPLPGALTSSVPPASFDGARAATTLRTLAAAFPSRPAGSVADDALAALVARRLRGDGLTVRMTYARAATLDGARRTATVIATQSGSGGAPLVLLAARDGDGAAALSGTAALLELAHDLAGSGGASRTLVFVSTSGAVAELRRPVAAAIVLGDLAGTTAVHPFIVPFSNTGSASPLALQQTLVATLPGDPGRPSLLDQLAEFAVPLAPGTQAPLLDAGIPAVLVQQSGQAGPAATEPVSGARLASFGRGVLAAIAALQSSRLSGAGTRDLSLAGDRLPGGAVRALIAALILAAALPALDLFARARRRRVALARWLAWLLLWAAPFGVAVLFTKLLALCGVLHTVAAPTIGGTHDVGALLATLAVFAVACAARLKLVRRPVLDASGESAGASVVVVGVATLLALALWIANPYTAALLALPLVFWLVLLAAETERQRTPLAGALWLALSLVPLGGVLAVEALALGLGPLAFAHTWLLVFASGQLGPADFVAVSLAGGLAAALAQLLIHPGGRPLTDEVKVTMRGPITYAGPGSLGGTASGWPSGR
jgi:hypothetical protein